MKRLLGILVLGYRIMWDKLDAKLDVLEINRSLEVMKEDKRRQLWKIIVEAGDYLQGQLPDHPNHPKGRNSYAHVAICVKSKFQLSYKDIEDNKFNDVIKFIDFLKQNPS